MPGLFEDYCREKWGWSKTHSNRIIEAAHVVTTLPVTPIGVKLSTESQARELAKVPADQREEVLNKAAATGKVTANKNGGPFPARRVNLKSLEVDSIPRRRF